MDQPVKKQVAMVTGVGRAEGIGYEVCRQLATQQIIVLLTARQFEEAKKLAEALTQEGLDVRPYELDINSEQSIRELAQEVQQEFGQLDILVNNAAGSATFGEKAAIPWALIIACLFHESLRSSSAADSTLEHSAGKSPFFRIRDVLIPGPLPGFWTFIT